MTVYSLLSMPYAHNGINRGQSCRQWCDCSFKLLQSIFDVKALLLNINLPI